jgi:hypothetical protein
LPILITTDATGMPMAWCIANETRRLTKGNAWF